MRSSVIVIRSAYFGAVVTVPFLTASLLGLLFSDMVRVVDCHAGVLDSNPGGPKDFPLGNTSEPKSVENTHKT